MRYSNVDSPLGKILVYGDERGLHGVRLSIEDCVAQAETGWVRDDAFFADARRQLTEYFEANREKFDLPLVLQGSEFQQKVWRALLEIPYGKTWSYGELARRIGMPTASRAVGAANGSNSLAIVVPCHRVIGADGSLTGYAAGVDNKLALLRLEGALPAGSRQARLV